MLFVPSSVLPAMKVVLCPRLGCRSPTRLAGWADIRSEPAIRGAEQGMPIPPGWVGERGWFRGVAQLGSAPALGAGGPRFESGRPD
jgi:hypothetical protein